MDKIKKIEVCHLTTLHMGGKETFLCNLLENTDFEKYDVTVINLNGESSDETIVSRLKKLPLKIIDNPFGTPSFLSRSLSSYKFFKKNHFDVFHVHTTHNSLSSFFLGAFFNGVPIRVAHSHTIESTSVKYKYNLGQHLCIIIKRIVFTVCSNRRLACSEEAAEYMFKRFTITPLVNKKNRGVVIPNGIVLEKFTCSNRAKHERTEILFVGRFSPEKNPVFAVQVFFQYLKKDPIAHMTMIGKGRLDDDVRTEINKLGLSKHIDIVPETGDMPKYYQAADLLLFPSLYEGLGIVLIEAQASGLKCLASTAVPRLSQCGLVDYRSLADGPEAWAKYMSQLLQNDSLKIDQEKLKFFDIKNTVRMIDEVYKR